MILFYLRVGALCLSELPGHTQGEANKEAAGHYHLKQLPQNRKKKLLLKIISTLNELESMYHLLLFRMVYLLTSYLCQFLSIAVALSV